MSQISTVALVDICDFLSGGTPSRKVSGYFTGDIPWITSADIVDNVVKTAREYITKDAVDLSATNIIPKGNLLLVTRTGVGKVAITGVDICFSQDFTGLVIDRTKADLWYLFYFLSSKQDFFIAQQRGATIQGVTREVVESIGVPLFSLPEQRRIATLLSHADRLRRQRRYVLELSDTYLQAVFLEMLGDSRKSVQVELEELLADDPKNGLYLPVEKYGEGTPIIRITEFYDGVLAKPEQFKRVNASTSEMREFAIANGEVLINRVNSLEYLGKCALVSGLIETTIFESNMMRIRLNDKRISPIYFVTYLSSQRAHLQILRMARKAVNQASINQTDVKSLVIPLPAFELQQKFAGIAQKFWRLQARQREALRQAEMLFQALLHQAFAGEL